MENNQQQLYLSAIGFYEVGLEIALKIKSLRNDNVLMMISPAAVNLSFSAELFLKLLHYYNTPTKIKKTHLLLDLFTTLPLKISKIIREKYEEFKLIKSENLVPVRLSNNTDFNNPNDQIIKYDILNLTVEELLEIHNKSFPEWRYSYATEDYYYVTDFNFKLMNDFILALKYVIDNQIKTDNKS